MISKYLSCLCVSLAGLFSGAVLGEESHPVIAGYERFAKAEEVSQVELGRLLINELNCASCHAGHSQWSVRPKQAPILTDVGERLRPGYFQKLLRDPHRIKPGTTMPDILASRPEEERTRIVESLAHFLASTGTPEHLNASANFVSKGETLFHQVGCVACHDPQNADVEIATSIPLTSLSEKYTLPSLTRFLGDPLAHRPSGRMPRFDLSGEEAQQIAAYLLRDIVIAPRLNFAYYEGTWEKLPDFDQLEPVTTGITSDFSIQLGEPDRFGIVFRGFWETTIESEYRFLLASDDGSRLLIDGELVVDNDGIHGTITAENKITLPPGIHEVEVQFFEKDGGESLSVKVYGGGLEGISLDAVLRATREPVPRPGEQLFVVDPVKSRLGKTYFQSVGCANCHDLQFEGELIKSSIVAAKPLIELNPEEGCLSAYPLNRNVPRFSFRDDQRTAIIAALRQLQNSEPYEVTLQQAVHERLLTLNCYACHSRESADGVIRGGVLDKTGESLEIFGRQKWFTGTQAEMGDEGQHPPYLKAIGAKFKPEWLNQVLQKGTKVRPYMHTRMPMFGTDNLGQLASQLIELDRLDETVSVNQTVSEREIRKIGRFFAGEESLACIKCHTFNQYPATGIQAMDLATMAERLDQTWFHEYMRKPSRFRRGTRMPESWPGGRTFYKDILDGNVDQQIDALWQYLQDGSNAAKPRGLIKSKMELIPQNFPLIYRNFIEGAGPRAIGVGYPEHVNLAFDAADCRIALIWQENFIDASRHWTGRGQGFEPPLGENVIQFNQGPTISLDSDSFAERPSFRGYRFDADRRPVFRYQLGTVALEDQPLPNVVEGDRPLLNRQLDLHADGSVDHVYLRIGDQQSEVLDRTVQVDERLSIQFNGPIRLASPTAERPFVLGTIELTEGAATVEQSYVW